MLQTKEEEKNLINIISACEVVYVIYFKNKHNLHFNGELAFY